MSLADFEAASRAFVDGGPVGVLEGETQPKLRGGWTAVGTGADRESREVDLSETFRFESDNDAPRVEESCVVCVAINDRESPV